MNFLFWLLFVLLCIMSLFMILMVLIQKGRGGGLSSSFGGGGGSTAFGSKTGDVLTWATSIAFGIFMLLAVGLNLVANKRQANWNVEHGVKPQVTETPPAAPVNPD